MRSYLVSQVFLIQYYLLHYNLHSLYLDIGFSLEDQPGEMDNKKGWKETLGNPCCQRELLMMMMKHYFC